MGIGKRGLYMGCAPTQRFSLSDVGPESRHREADRCSGRAQTGAYASGNGFLFGVHLVVGVHASQPAETTRYDGVVVALLPHSMDGVAVAVVFDSRLFLHPLGTEPFKCKRTLMNAIIIR